MNKKRLGLLLAALFFLLGAGAARACDVQGSVVCGSNGTGIANVVVTISDGTSSLSVVTGADGAFLFSVATGTAGFYAVTLDLSAAGGPASYPVGPVYIAYGTPWVIPAFQVDVPGCAPPPPPVTANCSPGYYKNHPQTWCTQCFQGVGCDTYLAQLGAQGPTGAALRESAKAAIDACFGTAAASPCTDD